MDIEKIIQQMTLEEKADFCSGSDFWHTQPVKRLGVPAVMMSDGPSGKLAETFPRKLSDTPAYLSFPGERETSVYTEGVFVGYRYYDTKEADVLFPFGHGLSYTTFAYSVLRLSRSTVHEGEDVQVTVTVKNTGAVAGKETVQLYVTPPKGARHRPIRELKGFAKVSLQPSESKEVQFTLDKRSLAYGINSSASSKRIGIPPCHIRIASAFIQKHKVTCLESRYKAVPVFFLLRHIGDAPVHWHEETFSSGGILLSEENARRKSSVQATPTACPICK